MDLEHKYAYTRHAPSVTHKDRDEVIYVGHRMGFTKRKDKLIPPGSGVDYNAWCLCGWVDHYDTAIPTIPIGSPLRKWVAKRHLTVRYVNHHIVDVKKQGVLRV